MTHPAPADPVSPVRWTTEQYFALVDQGVLGPDDKVELLEGVIVSTAPRNVPHDAGVMKAQYALMRAVGDRAVIRGQLTLVLRPHSVPEPDIAVMPGSIADYERVHPTTALLVIEVADSSLKTDRLTKAPMYAAAGIPEYWITNLRDDCVEVRRQPDPKARRYTSVAVARRGETIELVALPGVRVAVDDLLPAHE